MVTRDNLTPHETSFISWLETTLKYAALHLSIKHHKQREKELLILNAPVFEDDEEEMIHYIEDENVNVAEEAIDDLVIQEALSILTEKQRKVIVDKFFYGYTESEIAQKMGISRQ